MCCIKTELTVTENHSSEIMQGRNELSGSLYNQKQEVKLGLIGHSNWALNNF